MRVAAKAVRKQVIVGLLFGVVFLALALWGVPLGGVPLAAANYIHTKMIIYLTCQVKL